MADVKVTVTNNSGQKVTLTYDDKRDAKAIEYLQKRKRREELADVAVASKSAPKKSAESAS